MSKQPMRGHFRYLRFKTFPMTPRTPQCKVFWALLSSSEHSGVPGDSKSSLFPSVGLHPHTWPKQGCDNWGLQWQTLMLVHLLQILLVLFSFGFLLHWTTPRSSNCAQERTKLIIYQQFQEPLIYDINLEFLLPRQQVKKVV